MSLIRLLMPRLIGDIDWSTSQIVRFWLGCGLFCGAGSVKIKQIFQSCFNLGFYHYVATLVGLPQPQV